MNGMDPHLESAYRERDEAREAADRLRKLLRELWNRFPDDKLLPERLVKAINEEKL